MKTPKQMKELAVRLIKRGRRTYGGIYKLSDGREVYLAWRWNKEIYRAGEKCLSTAISINKASWAIDDETLLNLRIAGVTLVGVWVKDTGDTYIATLVDFLDSTKSKIMNFEGRGGALQRYLPMKYFGVRLGTARVK